MNRTCVQTFKVRVSKRTEKSKNNVGAPQRSHRQPNRALVDLPRATAALLGLLVLTSSLSGCAGSRLGETIGETLEPDPQLLENGEQATSDSDSTSDSEVESQPSATDSPSSTSRPNSEEDTKKKPAPTSNADTDTPKVTAGGYTDLAKAPEELQPYLVDLLELKLLEVRPTETPQAANEKPAATATNTANSNTASGDDEKPDPKPAPKPAPPPGPDEFRPNQAVTRREYARWLLTVNNKFYAGESKRKIRPGVSSSQPVFQDVPVSDPDFAAIQGLAEAGIIPSPLTGSSTTITFRPNAPLTRKDMLLWKVPLDTRQPLPTATATAVQQAWGFQDAAKIEARALQAVLADHQNGDFANIRRAFSYTTLFQPDKAATRAEAAAVLWRFGNPAEGITAAEIRNPQSTGGTANGTAGETAERSSRQGRNDS